MTDRQERMGSPGSHIWAAMAVGLLLLGRWSPDRLFDSSLSDAFMLAKIAALLPLMIIAVGPKSAITDRPVNNIAAFFALMVYVLVSYFWVTLWLPYSDSKLADLGYNALLVIVIGYGLRRASLRTAFWVVLVAALGAMALIGVVTLPSAIANSVDGRLAVLGGGPNIFGRNMGVLVLSAIFFGLNYPRVRAVCAALTGAAVIGLVASGSRGALGATMAGLLMLFIIDEGCRRFLVARPLMIALFTSLAAVVFLLADLGVVFEVGSQRFVEQTLETGYLSMRDILFDWSYAFWLEAPIFGNGLGSFASITELEYPHNIVMELLSETGAFGLAIFVIFMSRAILMQFLGGGGERGLVLAIILQLFIAAMVSGDFVDSRVLFLFLLYPAMEGWRRRRAEQVMLPVRAG